VDAQHCNGFDFAGLLPLLSQHDPPQQPQRVRWRNDTDREKKAAPGFGGDISDAASRLGLAGTFQPGSMVYPLRVNEMSVTRTVLAICSLRGHFQAIRLGAYPNLAKGF
jgi:hypothetical protein